MADDNSQHITAREFDGFKEAVVDAIGQSTEAMNKRFDSMERRFETSQKTTNDLIRIQGEQQTQLREHERRLNNGTHVHARRTDPVTPDVEPITVKDVKRAVYIAGLVLAVIGGIITYGPAFLKAIQ